MSRCGGCARGCAPASPPTSCRPHLACLTALRSHRRGLLLGQAVFAHVRFQVTVVAFAESPSRLPLLAAPSWRSAGTPVSSGPSEAALHHRGGHPTGPVPHVPPTRPAPKAPPPASPVPGQQDDIRQARRDPAGAPPPPTAAHRLGHLGCGPHHPLLLPTAPLFLSRSLALPLELSQGVTGLSNCPRGLRETDVLRSPGTPRLTGGSARAGAHVRPRACAVWCAAVHAPAPLPHSGGQCSSVVARPSGGGSCKPEMLVLAPRARLSVRSPTSHSDWDGPAPVRPSRVRPWALWPGPHLVWASYLCLPWFPLCGS